MAPCLIAVDLQRGYLDDARLEPAAGRLLQGAAEWLAEFRARGLPVAHVRTTVSAEGPALPHWDEHQRARFQPGAPSWAFAPEVEPEAGEIVVDKTHYSGFDNERLGEALAALGCEEVAVIGVHLHGCVRSTALDASAAGQLVTVGLDAIGSNDPPHAAATQRWMADRGFRLATLAGWRGNPHAAGRSLPDPQPAADRATAVFPAWATVDVERRASALAPLPALLREASERLAATMANEIGKPLGEAQAEIEYAAGLAEHALGRASQPALRTDEATARRVPHGPVLLVTPWNNPVAIPVGKLVPAIALGNTAIWKPSPRSPRTSAALAELLARLDLPPGVLERVEGDARTVSALIRSGAVRALSLSGSLEAGRAVQDLCATELIPLQAELGGNNAALVCPSAEPDQAAAAIASGAFGFAGQRCTATRRAILVGTTYAPVLHAVKAQAESLRAGDPAAPGTSFGPVVADDAALRLEALIERARGAGASVWRPTWATAPPAGGLPIVPPAVIEGAGTGSEILREESFGPILVATRVETIEEGIARCNEVPQGLVAAIHTSDPSEADRFAAGVHAGIVKLNQTTAGAAPSLPFGGLGRSGVGPAEHGEGDVEFFTRWQTIYGEAPGGSPGVAGQRRAEALA